MDSEANAKNGLLGIFRQCWHESFAPPPRIQLQSGSKRRIEFIDLAKGVCIILVVIMHTQLLEIPNVKNLRMPLYFILSGIFFRNYGSLRNFTIKKVNKIFIPFLFFYLLAIALGGIEHLIIPGSTFRWSFFTDIFTSRDMVNVPLWFLMCLFIQNIIFACLHTFLTQEWLRIFAVAALAALGWYIDSTGGFAPLYIDSALSTLPFFYMGYLLGKSSVLVKNRFDRFNIPAAVVLIILSYAIFFGFHNPSLEIRLNHFSGAPLLYYCEAAFFVVGTLLLCKVVKWLPLVSYFGRYSIIVLCVHYIILTHVLCVYDFFNIEPNVYATTSVTLLLSWLAIPVMKRYFPHVTAQSDWLKI